MDSVRINYPKCREQEFSQFIGNLNKDKSFVFRDHHPAGDNVSQDRYTYFKNNNRISIVYETKAQTLLVTAPEIIIPQITLLLPGEYERATLHQPPESKKAQKPLEAPARQGGKASENEAAQSDGAQHSEVRDKKPSERPEKPAASNNSAKLVRQSTERKAAQRGNEGDQKAPDKKSDFAIGTPHASTERLEKPAASNNTAKRGRQSTERKAAQRGSEGDQKAPDKKSDFAGSAPHALTERPDKPVASNNSAKRVSTAERKVAQRGNEGAQKVSDKKSDFAGNTSHASAEKSSDKPSDKPTTSNNSAKRVRQSTERKAAQRGNEGAQKVSDKKSDFTGNTSHASAEKSSDKPSDKPTTSNNSAKRVRTTERKAAQRGNEGDQKAPDKKAQRPESSAAEKKPAAKYAENGKQKRGTQNRKSDSKQGSDTDVYLVKGVSAERCKELLTKIRANKNMRYKTSTDEVDGAKTYTIVSQNAKAYLKYAGGDLQLSGAKGDLYSELQLMLSQLSDYKTAINSHIKYVGEEKRPGEIERQLKKILPAAYEFLSEQSKIDLAIGIIDINNSAVVLSDYSTLLIPCFRGLERFIFDLEHAQNISVKMIGQAYEKKDGAYVLKAGYRRKIPSVIYAEVMAALYAEYCKHRNFYTHPDGIGNVSRVISDKSVVISIFNHIMEVINYNGKKLKEIGFRI